ncbi:hypothetical protein PSA01_65750 [Pseudonocardia saturnea]|uniref:Uncharacterized protein n=1 Tax=Pseudonocardia saturnea TaxID=33909 RepID=A0ABQ0S9L9_9PSEU|nr:hypothetical protein Pdca_69200 [Pseudonocardia autotrophica]GEC29546.1 hypothetical protein PSA01_65750 [Pseudonocardia saturnea]
MHWPARLRIVLAAAGQPGRHSGTGEGGAEMGTARIVDPRLLVWLSGKKKGCEQFDRGVRGDVD